jgi:hypothetical protein
MHKRDQVLYFGFKRTHSRREFWSGKHNKKMSTAALLKSLTPIADNPNHLLLDSAPNFGRLISCWGINKYENC